MERGAQLCGAVALLCAPRHTAGARISGHVRVCTHAPAWSGCTAEGFLSAEWRLLSIPGAFASSAPRQWQHSVDRQLEVQQVPSRILARFSSRPSGVFPQALCRQRCRVSAVASGPLCRIRSLGVVPGASQTDRLLLFVLRHSHSCFCATFAASALRWVGPGCARDRVHVPMRMRVASPLDALA